MTLDEALKCADAAACNQWSRPSETAAITLAAEVRRLRAEVKDAVATERKRCHAIVSAPHWKQAVRTELSKRAEAIEALKDGEE